MSREKYMHRVRKWQKSESYKVFCSRLKSARALRGLTQLEMEKILGLGEGMVGKFERGRHIPSAIDIFIYLEKLKLPAEFLFGGEISVEKISQIYTSII